MSSRAKADDENQILLKRLQSCYKQLCLECGSEVSQPLQATFTRAIEKSSLPSKFFLMPAATSPCDEGPKIIRVSPLLNSIMEVNYRHIQELFIWNVALPDEDFELLIRMLEKRMYPLQSVELQGCVLNWELLESFGRAARILDCLTTINLSYNAIGYEGCGLLAKGLRGCLHLKQLCLNYCSLPTEAGRHVNDIICNTTLRQLSLAGNNLGAAGVLDVLQGMLQRSEQDVTSRVQKAVSPTKDECTKPAAEGASLSRPGSSAHSSASEGKKKKKKKRKKKKKKSKGSKVLKALTVGPQLQQLALDDNGVWAAEASDEVSALGTSDRADVNALSLTSRNQSILLAHVLAFIIENCRCLEQLSLMQNQIGSCGGRLLSEALQRRKKLKLPSLEMHAPVAMASEVFQSIFKLALKQPKRRRKKKT